MFRVKSGWFGAARCSDVDCRSKLRARDATCPRCGGTIAGTVATLAEARAAEARIEQIPSDLADDILARLKRP